MVQQSSTLAISAAININKNQGQSLNGSSCNIKLLLCTKILKPNSIKLLKRPQFIFKIFIDCKAREIMHLEASVRLSDLSWLNYLTLKFGVKGCHYQSKIFVCVFVIRGHMWITSQKRSIDF